MEIERVKTLSMMWKSLMQETPPPLERIWEASYHEVGDFIFQ